MHWRRWLFTFLFCFMVVGFLGFIKFNQVMAAIAFGASFPEPSETVVSEVVEVSKWQDSLSLSGSIIPTRSLEVRNELEGIISFIGFPSGGRVNKGDTLIQMQVDDELAQLDAINAEIQIAELDLLRFEKLLEQRAGSRDQYERAKAQLAVSSARKRSLEAVIAKKTIVAPFDAKAGLHQLEVGAFISRNTLITKLTSSSNTVWVDFNVPQAYAAINAGDSVNVSSNIIGLASTPAVVKAVDQEISTLSRNIKVRAELTSSSPVLKPGMIVSVSLPIDGVKDVVRLPTKAIRYDAFGSYVFVLEKDDKGDFRAKRQVVTLIANEGQSSLLELDGSLKPGDIVATQGSFKLRSGILTYTSEKGV
ncbi:efflux RND transporter periplasmic adaptor subunit [Glaciecola sp. MH2013]|uniref:efflux RND transporter periplasmic adaptor subunit n=1 Tax=Glaciecola sp. MH2013 TaxID=2785524 RepID=UPI00189E5568|nr:efflux RND transporter periplasmic adaptor subunit [Glaciecola sp. MH2013]MBF7073639.1 efflux RND transporter periplasmic adaptor subunit [Glaciecola sp. MH2013]